MLMPEKRPYKCVHSVRIEPTKPLLGMKTTYQATGDAGFKYPRSEINAPPERHTGCTLGIDLGTFSYFGNSG